MVYLNIEQPQIFIVFAEALTAGNVVSIIPEFEFVQLGEVNCKELGGKFEKEELSCGILKNSSQAVFSILGLIGLRLGFSLISFAFKRLRFGKNIQIRQREQEMKANILKKRQKMIKDENEEEKKKKGKSLILKVRDFAMGMISLEVIYSFFEGSSLDLFMSIFLNFSYGQYARGGFSELNLVLSAAFLIITIFFMILLQQVDQEVEDDESSLKSINGDGEDPENKEMNEPNSELSEPDPEQSCELPSPSLESPAPIESNSVIPADKSPKPINTDPEPEEFENLAQLKNSKKISSNLDFITDGQDQSHPTGKYFKFISLRKDFLLALSLVMFHDFPALQAVSIVINTGIFTRQVWKANPFEDRVEWIVLKATSLGYLINCFSLLLCLINQSRGAEKRIKSIDSLLGVVMILTVISIFFVNLAPAVLVYYGYIKKAIAYCKGKKDKKGEDSAGGGDQKRLDNGGGKAARKTEGGSGESDDSQIEEINRREEVGGKNSLGVENLGNRSGRGINRRIGINMRDIEGDRSPDPLQIGPRKRSSNSKNPRLNCHKSYKKHHKSRSRKHREGSKRSRSSGFSFNQLNRQKSRKFSKRRDEAKRSKNDSKADRWVLDDIIIEDVHGQSGSDDSEEEKC